MKREHSPRRQSPDQDHPASAHSPIPTAPQEPPEKDFEYNLVIAGRLLTRIATSRQSLIKICAAPDMPDLATLFSWLREWPEFPVQYELAMQTRADLLMEETLDLVDDLSQDVIVTADGKTVFNRVALQRCKLRIEHRKWIASKLLPEKYGNRPKEPKAPAPPEPYQERVMTEERRRELIARRRAVMEKQVKRPSPDLPCPNCNNQAPSTKNQELRKNSPPQ